MLAGTFLREGGLALRSFAIYNPLTRERKAAAWILYEPGDDAYLIELANWARPSDLPLALALFAEDGKRVISDYWARAWISKRVPPQERSNIDEVLEANRSSSYHLPALLTQTKGRSSLDDFLIEEVPANEYKSYDLNRALDAPVQLGTQLSRARRAANLTQAELAEISGLQQAVISRIESGKGNPTIETLEILAKGCGRNLRITLE